VHEVALALRDLMLRGSPAGVDVSGVRGFTGPGWRKLVEYTARRLAAHQLAARALRRRMPALGQALLRPWTRQTADEAYFLVQLARRGDQFAATVLRGLKEQALAEPTDALLRAMRMLDHLNELAAQQSPPPSALLQQPGASAPTFDLPALPPAGEPSLPALPELPAHEAAPPVEDDHPDIQEVAEEVVSGAALPELEHYLVVGRRHGKRRKRRISSRRAVQMLQNAARFQPQDQGAPADQGGPPDQGQLQDGGQGAPPDQGQLGDFADQGDPSAPQDGGQGQPQGDIHFADQA